MNIYPLLTPQMFPVVWRRWLADYMDAHNLAYAFHCSHGQFVWRESYSNPVIDDLIERGTAAPNGTERAQIYHDIQQLVVYTCPSVIFPAYQSPF